MEIQDFFLIAVGDQYQIEVSACGNHLIERTEFFKAQGALVLVCVCFLQTVRKVFFEPEITLSVWVIRDNHPAKETYVPPHTRQKRISLKPSNMMELVHRLSLEGGEDSELLN